jgi:anion-transporting  ArsA/GET3 family ATPase
VPALLDKRLVFVMGKGGVGRTTVAAALGLAAARRGLRTIVAEVAHQERLAAAFGRGPVPADEEAEIAPGLCVVSIDPQAAMEEYLVQHIPLRPLADVLARSAAFQDFAIAAPGMRELLTIGKIWDLAQLETRRTEGPAYDLVIVDAPATGHGIAFLRTPRTFADIAQVGPIARQGRRIQSFLGDGARTGIVAVALPEEMPVNELLFLRSELASDPGLGLDLVVVNGAHPDRFTSRDATRLRSARDAARSPGARAAIRAALGAHVRAKAERAQVRRLTRGCARDPVVLPRQLSGRLGPADYEAFSERLEAAL